MSARQYSNKAAPATLGGGISAADVSLSLSTVSGLPASFPFTLMIEPDSINQEVVTCTGLAGTIATVTRGQDGSTAVAHSAGAIVQHNHTARDFQEPQDHIAATVAHGATGAVVGTTNAQTLTNKTIALGGNTVSGTKAQFDTAVTDADLASLAGSETLTNKTLALGSNTVSGTRAQFNTAMTDDDFVSLTGSETLTNKTLTAPAISGPTITGTATAAVVNGTTVSASTHVQSPETTGGSGRTASPYGNIRKKTVAEGGVTQTIVTNTATAITFDAGDVAGLSTDSFADHANERLLVPVTGFYMITLQVCSDNSFSEAFGGHILVNGTLKLASRGYGAGGNSPGTCVTGFIRLTAGDFVTAEVFQKSGGVIVVSSETGPTFLEAIWLRP